MNKKNKMQRKWLENLINQRFGTNFHIIQTAESNTCLITLNGTSGIEVVADWSRFESATSEMPCTHWNPASETWLSPLGEIPAPGATSLPIPLIEKKSENHRIQYDILGLTWWMLSRTEEVGRADLDQHGRFPATSSHAYRHNYLERPIVDEWLGILGQVILRQWPDIVLRSTDFQTIVSCDVDTPYEPYIKSKALTLRRALGDLLKRGSIKEATKTFRNYWHSSQGNFSLDKNNTFEWMMDVNERAGNRICFYFLVNHTVPEYDAHYSIHEPRIRTLMRRIHSRGHHIGLHGSYGTYQNAEMLKKEASVLRQVLDEENIRQDEIGIRQHYLRWSTPATARHLAAAGLNYDTSLSYADHAGFRCGTCHEFQMIDPEKDTLLDIREQPLILMECTVIDERYMGLCHTEAALEKMIFYKQMCKKFRGNFTLLWHNSHLTTEKDRLFYQELIS